MNASRTASNVSVLANQKSFRSLSIQDLLEARDQYHVHLMNKPHVVGTALGLYLIRKSDPWPDRKHPHVDAHNKPKGERTFANSETRPYSWPCVLVLVDTWSDEKDFHGRLHPQDMVPSTLYMADGRMIPVCVVKVEPAAPSRTRLAPWIWPDTQVGGGFPILSRSQGETRVASVGCLVTDGHTFYAMTNRHVCGPAGSPVYSRLRGQELEIGRSSASQIARVPFMEVYPAFQSSRTYVNMDVGLIEIADVNYWTSSVYGLGEPGALADLNEQNLSLQLVNQPVCAFGGMSGHLEGYIKALFYRYQSVNGFDYVADMLIASDDARHQTTPGDSGTVWHLKVQSSAANGRRETTRARRNGVHDGPPVVYRPIAIEWGGQSLDVDGRVFNFALATNLSNACRRLDVEIVTEHNTAAQPYWGATGHYSIGRRAIDLVKDAKLAKLLDANADRISFDRSQLAPGTINDVLKESAFVPLADVPDIVWKKLPTQVKGGRDIARNAGPEHPTHYADIDEPVKNHGPTLRKLCMDDPARVSVAFWQQTYDDLKRKTSSDRGCLPFRVWQFYDALVGFAKKKDYAGFVTAAGLLAHYVGDSCQPLHGSVLADGYKDQAIDGTTSTGKPKSTWPGKGVHSVFETNMIDAKAPELFDEIDKALKKKPAVPKISSGHDAALATIKVMDAVAKVLPPSQLCDHFIELGEGASKAVVDGMWATFGTRTGKVMAIGIANLANIWDAAWSAGGGKNAAASSLKAFTEPEIRKRYTDTAFVPSLDLDHIQAKLTA
jgi:hypothetical protein